MTLQVFEFFKKRIADQYPAIEVDPNPYLQAKEQHESFMCNKAETVLGRDDILREVILMLLQVCDLELFLK